MEKAFPLPRCRGPSSASQPHSAVAAVLTLAPVVGGAPAPVAAPGQG